MKIKQIVIDPTCASDIILNADEKVALCVPSDWVNVMVLSWPGKLNRYRVWQRILAETRPEGPFNFCQAYDSSEKKTWVSLLQFQEDKWAFIPIPRAQVKMLTAPKVEACEWLPRHKAPFMLLAYVWLGQIELCAFRLGILQHAERGVDVSTVWSKVIQAMPVLAAAPLYTRDESLTQRFAAHHGVCHTL